jgi:hypothetical protein
VFCKNDAYAMARDDSRARRYPATDPRFPAKAAYVETHL